PFVFCVPSDGQASGQRLRPRNGILDRVLVQSRRSSFLDLHQQHHATDLTSVNARGPDGSLAWFQTMQSQEAPMAYKSLLTVATAPDRTGAAVAAAAAICQKADAHLDALALGVDRTQVGYSYVGTGAVVLQVAMERAEQDARANEKAVKEALAAQGPGLRSAVETAVTQMGALT